MAKRFSGDIHFDAAPDVVFAAQSDPHYVVWKHEHMAAFDVSADVEEDGTNVVVSSSRKLPAEVPSAAKRFVGESITIDEVHTWSHPETDGTRTGNRARDVRGCAPGRQGHPGAGPGRRRFRHEGGRGREGQCADGRGKLEGIVGEQFTRAMRKEQEIAPQWFTE